MVYRTRLLFGLQALILMVPVVLVGKEVRQQELNQELLGAVTRVDPGAVRQLLDKGADANVREKQPAHVAQLVKDFITQLHHGKPQPESFHEPALLMLGGDKAAPEEQRWIAVVTPLLNHGADIECQDEDGTTLLMKAALEHDSALVRLLLQRGAKVDAKLPDGETALCWADAGSAAILIKHGADVNVRSGYGGTPLQFAVMRGDMATVRLLLKAGADVNAKDRSGSTAPELAEGMELPQIAGLLRKEGRGKR